MIYSTPHTPTIEYLSYVSYPQKDEMDSARCGKAKPGKFSGLLFVLSGKVFCKDAHKVVATKPLPAIITTVVSAWSFLLTTMDLLAMRKRWSGDLLNGWIVIGGCSFNDKCYLSVSKDRLALLQGPGPNARVVYIDGGFDLFHAGHVEILKNARQLGDFLLVGIYTDLLEETTFRLIQKISSLSGENHFRKVESSDLIAYGFILEFVGRFPILVNLLALTGSHLIQEILEWLRDESVKILIQSMSCKKQRMDDSHYKFIVASSLYRVSETILIHCCKLENWPIDGQLLEWISNMIADILCACFTNLPCVIKKMCHHNAIEKREDSVAAQLLRRSKKILEILNTRQIPNLDVDSMADIGKWHALSKSEIPNDSPLNQIQLAFPSPNESVIVNIGV
ncbi:Rho guanyl-nucleotide exchange factor 12 [Tanacetum coccineum]|uniref:Rho guanyl-nucleotide exchange factor 12 n=1 Tax=Tanacetum coccineum TaxID=301880 RepID=A0ABQ5GUE7_9ASTR